MSLVEILTFRSANLFSAWLFGLGWIAIFGALTRLNNLRYLPNENQSRIAPLNNYAAFSKKREIQDGILYITHIPQFMERKNRIANTPDQADEGPADEELAAPELGFANVNQHGCARDQCPQNIGKSSASWDDWLAC
jgi:hypothetical protein